MHKQKLIQERATFRMPEADLGHFLIFNQTLKIRLKTESFSNE
jgi:hypothetical protein